MILLRSPKSRTKIQSNSAQRPRPVATLPQSGRVDTQSYSERRLQTGRFVCRVGSNQHSPLDHSLFLRNSVWRHGRHGIQVSRRAGLQLEGNLISENAGCGIQVLLPPPTSSQVSAFEEEQLTPNFTLAEGSLVVQNKILKNGACGLRILQQQFPSPPVSLSSEEEKRSIQEAVGAKLREAGNTIEGDHLGREVIIGKFPCSRYEGALYFVREKNCFDNAN